MDADSRQLNDQSAVLLPAPLNRRFGASLLDNAFALAAIYLSTVPIHFANQHGFGHFYLAVCQSFIIAWAILKDAWWPGQSAGKRISRIAITTAGTGNAATRLRCVGRQVIFTLIAAIFYLPAYFYFLPTVDSVKQGIFSTVLSASAPIRLLGFLPAAATRSFNPIIVAHLLLLGFVILELIVICRRPDRRRILDLLARTEVTGDRKAHPS